jgi:hypothetical protein
MGETISGISLILLYSLSHFVRMMLVTVLNTLQCIAPTDIKWIKNLIVVILLRKNLYYICNLSLFFLVVVVVVFVCVVDVGR